MRISELPPDIREKALEYQRNVKGINWFKDSDDLDEAFDWSKTKEGIKYWNDWWAKKSPKETTDKIVLSVINDLNERSKVGLDKYGVTLDRNDLSRKEWLQHAYEECLDQANYLKKLITLENEIV